MSIKVKIENTTDPLEKDTPAILISNTGAQAGMVLEAGNSAEYNLESADVLTVQEKI